ncbi:hypothetical protein QA612_04815 [Evansella sp. AB-P1]|uniref:hypothetical protein n=1 Tax=Evansella sp. AB-P1 TaxID=3037653 RepID=UPI00241D3BA1|nr:hypothetical protein [Evansella sp. AB-P1]MDG5786804.1 hypothetical protein [Evansella sp. AB-P1]
MKKVLFTVLTTGLILLTACTNGDASSEGENIDENVINEETDDLQTLIETNEYLVQEQTRLREENDEYKVQIADLEAENATLKNDILTFKQQINAVEDFRKEELALRRELDELAMDIFKAMDERNHIFLERSVHSNIVINEESDALEISDTENMSYTFQYITLSPYNYIRQVDFEYDKDEKVFTSRYSFHTTDQKDIQNQGDIIMTFALDSRWKLRSIIYN